MTEQEIITALIAACASFALLLIVAFIGFKMLPRIARNPAWWLPRSMKNAAGSLVGFDGCKCCRDRWNWKKHHITEYNATENDDDEAEPTTGVFPLCEECWHELGTAEARMPYYHTLLNDWLEMAPHSVRIRIEQVDRPAIVKAVNQGL